MFHYSVAMRIGSNSDGHIQAMAGRLMPASVYFSKSIREDQGKEKMIEREIHFIENF